jgi:hypothetical protein
MAGVNKILILGKPLPSQVDKDKSFTGLSLHQLLKLLFAIPTHRI